MCHFFFVNQTAPTEIYTLSLHDALPISPAIGRDRDVAKRIHAELYRVRHVPIVPRPRRRPSALRSRRDEDQDGGAGGDRKSTRLNSSHSQISYAVFCLKKKIIYDYLQ